MTWQGSLEAYSEQYMDAEAMQNERQPLLPEAEHGDPRQSIRSSHGTDDALSTLPGDATQLPSWLSQQM